MPRNPGGTVSGFKLLSTPDAPTITGVTTSIGSASVAFTAPSDTGDGAISSYVVTAVDESSGASTGGTGTSSPITVSPPAGGTFKIRMQALNPYGPGRLTEYDTGNAIYGGAELYAWGASSGGRLGDGTTVYRSSPVQIGALTTWSQVAGGERNSFAVKTDGTLWGWGQGLTGQIGDNTATSKSSPVQVGALTTWYQVTGGGDFAVAVKTDGTMWSWGKNETFGMLGVGTVINKSSPVQIGALTTWYQVSSARFHSVALKTDGTMWSWGAYTYGRLGDNTNVNKSSPVQIGSLTTWYQASAGRNLTSAAIKTDGTLWSWGGNGDGQLGDGTTVNRSSPVQVGSLTNWSQVSVGRFHTAAVKTDGTMWAWGLNSGGEIGDNTIVSKSSPVQIGALTNWAKITTGYNHCVAVKVDSTLWVWGSNDDGQLGIGITLTNRSSPVQIGALTTWLQASAGNNHTLALYGVV